MIKSIIHPILLYFSDRYQERHTPYIAHSRFASDVTLDTSNHKHDTEKTPIANFSRVLVERNPDQEINQPTKRNGSMPWFS